MCSVLFLRTLVPFSAEALARANVYAQRRGPTSTHLVRLSDGHGYELLLMHNLLDISGHGVRQPVVSGDSGTGTLEILLFNGEIYNYDRKNHDSDTSFLAKRLVGHADSLGRALDGEYAILHYSQSRQELMVIADPFLTKPLYLGRKTGNADFGVASYASTLRALGFDRVERVAPNSVVRVGFVSGEPELRHTADGAFAFDLRQHRSDFSGWEAAFLDAVRKRATHGAFMPYVNLSSGYDSGAVCLALNLLQLPYETFTITSSEDPDVIRERIRLNRAASCRKAHVFDGIDAAQRAAMAHDIATLVEPFDYEHDDAPGLRISLQRDDGAVGVNFLAGQAQGAGFRVNISGAGADEILSDYGINGQKIYHHSEFAGVFPERLEGFFPWKKFYGDTQRSYLFKEEFILGRHGIEGRYPFLDAALVQEFLWLSPQLKNLEYKAPIAHFLRTHGYPFEAGVKRGFAPSRERLRRRWKKALRSWFKRLLA
jgi:asparagine synthetase B (glutamine-hydrolysing)